MSYKIIENFLDKKLFDEFQAILMSTKMYWFFEPTMIKKDGNKFYLSHKIYDMTPISTLYNPYIKTVFDKLNCKAPIVARANMYVHRNKKITSSPHIDTGWKNHKTAILYMNTNNGYTALGKKKIMSKANRMLIFDSGTKHYAASQTDKDRRILININYF